MDEDLCDAGNVIEQLNKEFDTLQNQYNSLYDKYQDSLETNIYLMKKIKIMENPPDTITYLESMGILTGKFKRKYKHTDIVANHDCYVSIRSLIFKTGIRYRNWKPLDIYLKKGEKLSMVGQMKKNIVILDGSNTIKEILLSYETISNNLFYVRTNPEPMGVFYTTKVMYPSSLCDVHIHEAEY
jgi:hypothetical protein